MADGEYRELRGELAILGDKIRESAGRFRNAIEGLRRAIILYETPADVNPDVVRAAVDQLIEEREMFVNLRAQAEAIRRRLGMV